MEIHLYLGFKRHQPMIKTPSQLITTWQADTSCLPGPLSDWRCMTLGHRLSDRPGLRKQQQSTSIFPFRGWDSSAYWFSNIWAHQTDLLPMILFVSHWRQQKQDQIGEVGFSLIIWHRLINEKRDPGSVGYMGVILPSYIGIRINRYKDPY